MSNFIRPWDVNQEAAAEEAKPKRGLFDNLDDAFSAISANFDDVRGSERLGDLRNELMNPELSDEEYNRKRGEYVQEYLNREDARRRYAEAHQNLVNDDSFLKNIDQMGGTLEGMAAQGIGTAVGAGVGFLTPVVGGTAMGAKIGNAAGAVAGAHLDARSVALQAEEDVINAGGTWEQAKQAYDETLKKAYITTVPETAADIILGSRIGSAALNSGIARKIAGSTVGRVGASVLDPAAKIGTAVSRATRPIVGRGAGLLTDIGLQAGTEALQEVSQDYIANREVAKALGQQDNEYSLGGFKDYALSPQGLETIKTSAIMGGLFGGVGGVLSSGQYLQHGAKTRQGNATYQAVKNLENDGKFAINADNREAEVKTLAEILRRDGVDENTIRNWSDAELAAASAEVRGKFISGITDEAQDQSIIRQGADTVNRFFSTDEDRQLREGDVNNPMREYLHAVGVDDDAIARMFTTQGIEKSVVQNAKEQVEKQESNEQTKAKLTQPTIDSMEQEQQASGTERKTDGAIDDFTLEFGNENNIGEKWEYVKQGDVQYVDTAIYRNRDTGRIVTVQKAQDGKIQVVDHGLNANEASLFNADNISSLPMKQYSSAKEAKQKLLENEDNKDDFRWQGKQQEQAQANVKNNDLDKTRVANDIDSFIKLRQQKPWLIDDKLLLEFSAIMQRAGMTKDAKIDYYFLLDQASEKGYGQRYTTDEGKAIVELYLGADIGTVVHELGHGAYWNLSQEDRNIFNKYAVKSCGEYIANIMGEDYDQNFVNRLQNYKKDKEFWNKMREHGAVYQTMFLLESFQVMSQRQTDQRGINRFMELRQQAIEERFAWEFSQWYVQGYAKGVSPNNAITRITQRGCFTVADKLNRIQQIWEYLHHRGGDYGDTPIESMYANAELGYTGNRYADLRDSSDLWLNETINPPIVKPVKEEPVKQETTKQQKQTKQNKEEKQPKQAYTEEQKAQNKEDEKIQNRKTVDVQGRYKEQQKEKVSDIIGEFDQKSQNEVDKLVDIIKNKKSGWQKALQKLSNYSPSLYMDKLNSIKNSSNNPSLFAYTKTYNNPVVKETSTNQIQEKPTKSNNIEQKTNKQEQVKTKTETTNTNKENKNKKKKVEKQPVNPVISNAAKLFNSLRGKETISEQEKESVRKAINDINALENKNDHASLIQSLNSVLNGEQQNQVRQDNAQVGVETGGVKKEPVAIRASRFVNTLTGKEYITEDDVVKIDNFINEIGNDERLRGMREALERLKAKTIKEFEREEESTNNETQQQPVRKFSRERFLNGIIDELRSLGDDTKEIEKRIKYHEDKGSFLKGEVDKIREALKNNKTTPSTENNTQQVVQNKEQEQKQNETKQTQPNETQQQTDNRAERIKEELIKNGVPRQQKNRLRAYLSNGDITQEQHDAIYNELFPKQEETNKQKTSSSKMKHCIAYVKDKNGNYSIIKEDFRTQKDFKKSLVERGYEVIINTDNEDLFNERLVKYKDELEMQKERDRQKAEEQARKEAEEKAKEEAKRKADEEKARLAQEAAAKEAEKAQKEAEEKKAAEAAAAKAEQEKKDAEEAKKKKLEENIEKFKNQPLPDNIVDQVFGKTDEFFKYDPKVGEFVGYYKQVDDPQRVNSETGKPLKKVELSGIVDAKIYYKILDKWDSLSYSDKEKMTTPIRGIPEFKLKSFATGHGYVRQKVQAEVKNETKVESKSTEETNNKNGTEPPTLTDKEIEKNKKDEQKRTDKNNKKKGADAFKSLKNKFKNITGGEIGAKTVYKADEKQFIRIWIDRIDDAITSKKETLNSISNSLDEWKQNNINQKRTEVIYNYINNYIIEAGKQFPESVQKTDARSQSRAEQNRRILEKAFPDARFQWAWHGTRYRFNEFTLEHIGKGEGERVSGWGLYFSKTIETAKAYYDLLKNDEITFTINGEEVIIKNADIKKGKYNQYFTKDDLLDILFAAYRIKNYEAKEVTKKDIIQVLKNERQMCTKWIDEFNASNIRDRETIGKINDLYKVIRHNNYLIGKLANVSLSMQKKDTESGSIILVNIPEDNELLHESKEFKDHSKNVQRGLLQAYKEAKTEIINKIDSYKYSQNRKNELISEVNDMLDINNLKNCHGHQAYEMLADAYSYCFMDKRLGFDNTKYTKLASEKLNEKGIKGLTYLGTDSPARETSFKDGDCFVIFDDTAIDILTKFEKEQGKWKSEKVDNAKNRELDEQKAQKKLQKRNSDSRYMAIGEIGIDSPLKNEEFMEKLETRWEHSYRIAGYKYGYTKEEINQSLEKYRGVEKEKVFDAIEDKLAKIYIDLNRAANMSIWKPQSKEIAPLDFQRGLDGKWRFYISDKDMKLKVSLKQLKAITNTGKQLKLKDIVKHDSLFKYYPQLGDINVEINDSKYDKTLKDNTYGYYEKQSNTIVFNNEFLNRKNNLEETLLHEVQHAIQHIEGFAIGGAEESIKNNPKQLDAFAQSVWNRKEEFRKYLEDNTRYNKGTIEHKVDEIFITPKVIRNRISSVLGNGIFMSNAERDFKKWITSDNKLFEEYASLLGEMEARDTEKRLGFKTDEEWRKNIPLISDKYYRNASYGQGRITSVTDSRNQKKSKFTNKDGHVTAKAIKEAIDRDKKFEKQLNERRRVENMLDFSIVVGKGKLGNLENFMSREDIDLIRDDLISYAMDNKNRVITKDNLLDMAEWDIRQIQAYTDADERIPEAKDVHAEIRENFRKRLNATSKLFEKIPEGGSIKLLRVGEESSNNIIDITNRTKNNDSRYQSKKSKKKQEERERIQREIEEAKEKGEVTDTYKDVYSVSFDKEAQQNAENQKKIEYFEKRGQFWERHESNGLVTYTRKNPFEHHKKTIKYTGINGIESKEKEKSKLGKWYEWAKDQMIKYWFNDKQYLAKAARKLGVYDAYVRMMVTEGYAQRANVALTEGIMYNGKRTRALNDIIREVGYDKQRRFLDYCIAHRIKDLKNRDPEILQKMSVEEADEIIEDIKNSEYADLFEKNRKDFVDYNKALLHVLVDGGIYSEEDFQKFCDNDPNFVPLAKVMDNADMGFNSIIHAHSLINAKKPIKKIGTSMREIKNPFLEMQKRTAEYYSIAARNRAGQIFVNEICGHLDRMFDDDVSIARGQGLIREVKVDEQNGRLITRPDDKKQIIYVCDNGKHKFYQVADREIYLALKSLNDDQMNTLWRMIDNVAHKPAKWIRESATIVPDFGVRNLIRDNAEAFLTSEHGFFPFFDALWGMYQMANNTEWYQRYLDQVGEYGTLNRDNERTLATYSSTIDDKISYTKNLSEIYKQQMAIIKDTDRAYKEFINEKNSPQKKAMAAIKLFISPIWAGGKTLKRFNDYMEQGTRIGEFKNAKKNYNGFLDRMSKDAFKWDVKFDSLNDNSDIMAAGAAKEITLNFSQHGIWGKQLNRWIPFFNATLQGLYKFGNTMDLLFKGNDMSNQKNRRLQKELAFKVAMLAAFGIGTAAAGEGDEDYEEAPEYEKQNFWIFPNGIRIPKDQVLGTLIGTAFEQGYTQWRKGKTKPSEILNTIIEHFKPNSIIPAIVDIWGLGFIGNYDSFKKQQIVPEWLKNKRGFLQKDINTSYFASRVSEVLYKTIGADISAKKIDYAIQKNFSNSAKYFNAVIDLAFSDNEKMARGYDKSDSTGEFVGGLRDKVPSPFSLVTGTFATNRTQFKSVDDFYKRYNELKVASSDEESMTREEKRAWKRYQDAYKKDTKLRKQLKAIKQNKSLSGAQKREQADRIFKQQIKLAKWAED